MSLPNSTSSMPSTSPIEQCKQFVREVKEKLKDSKLAKIRQSHLNAQLLFLEQDIERNSAFNSIFPSESPAFVKKFTEVFPRIFELVNNIIHPTSSVNLTVLLKELAELVGILRAHHYRYRKLDNVVLPFASLKKSESYPSDINIIPLAAREPNEVICFNATFRNQKTTWLGRKYDCMEVETFWFDKTRPAVLVKLPDVPKAICVLDQSVAAVYIQPLVHIRVGQIDLSTNQWQDIQRVDLKISAKQGGVYFATLTFSSRKQY